MLETRRLKPISPSVNCAGPLLNRAGTIIPVRPRIECSDCEEAVERRSSKSSNVERKALTTRNWSIRTLKPFLNKKKSLLEVSRNQVSKKRFARRLWSKKTLISAMPNSHANISRLVGQTGPNKYGAKCSLLNAFCFKATSTSYEYGLVIRKRTPKLPPTHKRKWQADSDFWKYGKSSCLCLHTWSPWTLKSAVGAVQRNKHGVPFNLKQHNQHTTSAIYMNGVLVRSKMSEWLGVVCGGDRARPKHALREEGMMTDEKRRVW